jgi:hypothetical protein
LAFQTTYGGTEQATTTKEHCKAAEQLSSHMVGCGHHHGEHHEVMGMDAKRGLSAKGQSKLCFAFVDDTDLVHTSADPKQTVPGLIAKPRALNMGGLLNATGGALEPTKATGTFCQ